MNSIMTVKSANFDLTVEEVRRARELIASARVLLTQLESPQDAVLEALKIAKENNGTYCVWEVSRAGCPPRLSRAGQPGSRTTNILWKI